MKNRSFFLANLFFVVLFLFSSCYKEDKGNEKITPSLRAKLDDPAQLSSINNTTHDVVVVLDKNTTEPPSNIRSEDIKYVARDLVHAVFLSANSSKIRELAKDSRVVSIDEDYPVKTSLMYATKQLGTRDVWSEGYKGKYFGGTSSNIRIAVVDTGISVDHDDFNGRIVEAVNCYNQDCSTVGQKDDHGHGTHVAGIILGSGASCVGDNAYFEFSDDLPTEAAAIPYFFPTQFEGTGAVPFTLSAQLTWSGNVGTSAGVFFRTREKAEDQAPDYIAPGLMPDTLITAGPGVTGTSSIAEFTNPLSSSATDTHIPFSVSFYTSDSSVSGKSFWAYVKTTVKGWSDAFPKMAGMSYESQLVAVKTLGATGTGNVSDIVRGLEYVNSVAQSDNIVAANLSFSIGGGVNSSVIDAAVHSLIENGVIVAVSAGNDQESGYSVSSPGDEPLAITVGAVNDLDQVTEYSSLGSIYASVIKPDVLAPGGSRITKTYIASSKTLDSSQWNHTSDPLLSDPYVLKVGTSQAAPFVTGLTGLMASKHSGGWTFGSPALPKLFKMIICMSAYEVGAGESGKIISGYSRTAVSPGLPERAGGLKDYVEGYGRICAQGAMSAFDSSGMSFTFGDGLGEQKSFIRKVTLSASKEYNYTMNVPSGADFDLYLFDGSPDDNGEPVLLASSALKNASVERIVDFIPPSDGDYYLVAKWISGSGTSSIVLGSERPKPATPTMISNASVYRDVVSKQIVARWKTNVPTTDVIQYGEEGGMGQEGHLDEYATEHEYRINIDFGKNYYLRMLSSSSGTSEEDISTAVTKVYKISTKTGVNSLVYDIAPDDLPSLPAGGCGTVQSSQGPSQNTGLYMFLLPIMLLLFMRLRLRYSFSGGRS